MPFRLLTLEELKPLESEMISFLALNGISGSDWEKMKTEHPTQVNDYIQQFSDFVWMKILTKQQFVNVQTDGTSYFYHFMPLEVSIFKVIVNEKKGENFIGQQNTKYEGSREELMYDILETGGTFSDGKEYKELSILWASKKMMDSEI